AASSSRSSPGSTSRSGSASRSSTASRVTSGSVGASSGTALGAAFAAWPRVEGAFAAGALARVFFGGSLGAAAWGLGGRAAVLVARFAGAEPLADFAVVRLAPALAGDPGDFVAVRFTGSSVAGLALVGATYTPSVGLTSGGSGHGQPKV